MRMLKLLVTCLVAFGSFTAVAEEMDFISMEITEGKIVAAQLMNLEHEYERIVEIVESIGMYSREGSAVMTSASQLEFEAVLVLDEARGSENSLTIENATKRLAEIKIELLKLRNQMK